MKSFHPCLPLFLIIINSCKEQHKAVPLTPNPDYNRGVSLMSTRHDSAYYYLNKAATESRDSLQIAQALNVMAVIQSREGDHYGAQENLLTSIKFLHTDRENDQYCLVADYNVLGNTSLNLKNYDAALDYYDRAYRLAKNDRSKSVALNNKARTYQEMEKYAQATAIYDSILPQIKKDKEEYARVLCNLATARWQMDSSYLAAPDLLTALQIRKDSNDEWGLNSSYAHLADYYSHSQPDSALFYSRAMYAMANRLKSPGDQLEALEKLIRLGPAKEAKRYFARYRELKDSLETTRNNAKNQFALIRYDSEKNKTDNLRLQRENAERRAEVVRQRAISGGAIFAILMLIGWGISWYRKRKQKMEWERDAAIQKDRLKTSRKVHDVVANGLYSVMTEIEYGGNLETEQLLDKIEVLYNKSRDISYEPGDAFQGSFQEKVTGLLSPFGNPDRKVSLTGNEIGLWANINQKIKSELEPILQELMINMDKHSGARNVLLRFEKKEVGLTVQYMDDGVGLPVDHHLGNGLTNTGNRIAGLGGRISFERNSPSGVKIRIYIPNA